MNALTTDPGPANDPAPTIGPAPVTGPGPATGPTTDAGPATRAARRRRWLWPMAVTATVVAVGLLSAALVRTESREELDPRSSAPGGSRAVAEILRAQGVRVDVVTRSTEAVAGPTGTAGDVTVAVLRPQLLGPEQLRRLADSRSDLVLVEPDLVVLAALAPALTPSGVEDVRTADPACTDRDAVAAGTVSGGGRLYAISPGAADGATVVGCYPDTRRPGRFSVVRVTDGDRRITVLGQREVLQNGSLVSDGNAALALRVLGARPSVRWYLPDPAELGETTSPPTISELLPGWARWAFWQVVVALVVLMLWRGRRLGRVVAEPLPVVVRSAETVEGRARLYRAGRARAQAAAVLRTAAVRRLATRLGVPPDADPADVVQVAARATGRDPVEVHAVLLGAPPRDDAALVALAGAIDEIEHSLR